MNEQWVRASDKCSQEEISTIAASAAAQTAPFKYLIAFCTDRLVTANAEHLDKVLADADHILELRIFSERSELRFFRSMMGSAFKYRLADDKDVDPECMLESIQKLDVDTSNPPRGEANFGGVLVRSTGGGVYELPVSGAAYVKLVRYIRYNEDDGMAGEADFRVKDFIGKEN